MNRGSASRGDFLRAAIIPQGLVETHDEARQGRGIAKGMFGRKPGHAFLAVADLVILGPEAENGHAQVGVALDRNKQGIAGSC